MGPVNFLLSDISTSLAHHHQKKKKINNQVINPTPACVGRTLRNSICFVLFCPDSDLQPGLLNRHIRYKHFLGWDSRTADPKTHRYDEFPEAAQKKGRNPHRIASSRPISALDSFLSRNLRLNWALFVSRLAWPT